MQGAGCWRCLAKLCISSFSPPFPFFIPLFPFLVLEAVRSGGSGGVIRGGGSGGGGGGVSRGGGSGGAVLCGCGPKASSVVYSMRL